MVLDPNRLPQHRVQVAEDRYCAKCGYLLRGLWVGDPCPECGREIPPKVVRRLDDTMTDAGIPYLRGLAAAFTALAAAATLAILARLVHGYWQAPITAFAALGSGLAWIAMVWIVTQPKPARDTTTSDPRTEMPRTRSVARWTQLGWVLEPTIWLVGSLAGTGAGVGAGAGTLAQTINILEALAATVAMFGFVPLSVWLATFADWARDDSLGGRFRVAAWLTTAGALYFVGQGALVAKPILGGMASLAAIVGFWALVGAFVGQVIFFFSLLQLAALANAAVTSARRAEDAARRILARKAMLADTTTRDAPPGEIRREELSVIPCAACGYNLTGLPPGLPCPECGTAPLGARNVRPVPRPLPPPPGPAIPLPEPPVHAPEPQVSDARVGVEQLAAAGDARPARPPAHHTPAPQTTLPDTPAPATPEGNPYDLA